MRPLPQALTRLLATALLAAAASGDNRLWRAAVELEGPLDAVVLRLEGSGSTRVEAALLAGEERRLLVPLAARVNPTLGPPASWPEPDVAVEGAGRARFAGWEPDPEPAFWAGVPRELRSRPRPPLEESEARAGAAALALVAAAFALLLGWRRRPRLAALAGLAGAGAVLLVPLAADPDADRVEVLEGRAAEGLWLRVGAARGSLVLPPEAAALLEVQPPGVPLAWELQGTGPEPARAGAPGALLYLLERWDPAGRRPRAGANELGALAAVWIRRADGSLSARGAWRAGEPLPAEPATGTGPAEPPPGWLLAGLPQGTPVLLARRAGPGPPRWVRVSGFEESP